MDRHAHAPVTLATFDAEVARAVVAVLREHDLPAWLEEDTPPADGGELSVLVDPGRREEALALLAARMESVAERAGRASGPAPADAGVGHAVADATDPPPRPIVLETLRRRGLAVALLLAPLLAVTLAAPALPTGYALAVLVLGAAAVVYWRNRSGGPS